MARSTTFDRLVDRATARRHAVLAEDIERLREDAGVSRAQLALAAGVDASYLARIESGRQRPSVETYQRLALALGADLAARLYPSTGPAIRDRHQARILELLLRDLHPRWQAYPEVAVRRPSRGWIDVALHDPLAALLIAAEIQSGLQRLEQVIRWSGEKAASLPSWEGWPRLGAEPAVSRLLVVRRTRANRETATAFERQLRLAYPAHPADALAALLGTGPWPGPALIWVVVEGARSRLATDR
jgi:transcriptional regulator with XRE-family HTH domain